MERRTNGRAGGHAGETETLADYRARQARQWMERNAARLRREFWELQPLQSFPRAACPDDRAGRFSFARLPGAPALPHGRS